MRNAVVIKGNKAGMTVYLSPECSFEELIQAVKKKFKGYNGNITVAVMGCAVNGPGEAREADYGVAGGDGKGLLFAKGEIVRTVPEAEIVPALLQMIKEGM